MVTARFLQVLNHHVVRIPDILGTISAIYGWFGCLGVAVIHVDYIVLAIARIFS